MSYWIRLGKAVTWLTLAVCAAAPTLGAVGLLRWLATTEDDDLMLRLVAQVPLPFVTMLALVMLALWPWWALAWALLLRDRTATATVAATK